MNSPPAGKAPPQRGVALGAYVVGVAYDATGNLAAATGAGKIVVLPADPLSSEAPREIVAHRGASLSFARDPGGKSFLSGGDDGRLVRVALDGTTAEILNAKGKWIEAIAVSERRGLVAASAGRSVHLLAGEAMHELGPHPSTVMDIAFSPDGSRLAASHYGGASIHLTARPGESPRRLAWKGSHLAVRYSPSSKFLATATQENAIHVWRLASGADMQMQGYVTKVKSLAWSFDGNWLVSSGTELAVCWGFAGKGPEGQPPMELDANSVGATVARVAAHPAAPFIALGFSHGAIEIADLAKKRVMPLAEPTDSPVSAIAWSSDGWRLAVGTEAGELRLFDLKPRT